MKKRSPFPPTKTKPTMQNPRTLPEPLPKAPTHPRSAPANHRNPSKRLLPTLSNVLDLPTFPKPAATNLPEKKSRNNTPHYLPPLNLRRGQCRRRKVFWFRKIKKQCALPCLTRGNLPTTAFPQMPNFPSPFDPPAKVDKVALDPEVRMKPQGPGPRRVMALVNGSS